MMKKHEFQELVDQNLSGLVWDERRQQTVLHAIRQEEKHMKKKVSATFILVAAILCISVTAMAAGLLFSPRYEAGKLASKALKEQYGLTDEVLGLFAREISDQGDGRFIVTYSAPAYLPGAQIGQYTVQVNGKQVSAAWSNDGKDTSGGLLAEAFGMEQLQLLTYDFASTMQQLRQAGLLASDGSPQSTPNPRLLEKIDWTAADQLAADEVLEKAALENEERLAEIAKAEALGQWRVDQAIVLAQEAIVQEYSLSAAQQQLLANEPDSTYAVSDGNETLVCLLFWLWQRDDGQFTEKDGQYWVTFNLSTGVIEEILYDPCLAGNG